MDDPGIEAVKVRVLPDGRVTRRDAAIIFDRQTKTLAHWKMKGWGPKPVTVGGREFYSIEECLAMARGEKPIKPEAA